MMENALSILIDIFSHNSKQLSPFNNRTLRFAEKFDHPFSHVFIFANMFRESYGFISVPVTSSNNFVSFTNEIGINGNKIFVLYQRYIFYKVIKFMSKKLNSEI